MPKIWTMGEILCEIMRPQVDMPLGQPGPFLGPFPSGAPANFIDAVARLGVGAGIIGGVGCDDFGDCVLTRLETDGVDISQVARMQDGSTGVAFVTYFSDGSRRFLFHFPGTPATRAVAPGTDVYGDDVRFFHIMGCSLMAEPAFGDEILKVMDTLTEKGAKVSFDPNLRPELMHDPQALGRVERVLARCSVLLPGEGELLALTGAHDIEAAVAACFERPRMELVALKRGSRGSTLFTRNERVDLGVYPLPPVDATGAGDAFDAALLCGLTEGRALADTARRASAAAALCMAALGPMEGDITPARIAHVMETVTMTETGR